MPHPNKAHQDKNTLTFEQWEAEVNAICEEEMGQSLHDLPDVLTRDGYDRGYTPANFFDYCIVEDLDGYEQDEIFATYYQEFDTFTDADPGL